MRVEWSFNTKVLTDYLLIILVTPSSITFGSFLQIFRGLRPFTLVSFGEKPIFVSWARPWVNRVFATFCRSVHCVGDVL
jgi:hypothetical protein